MALNTLPYDLLLNIATRLDLRDLHALHLTCKSLYDFSTARPVYRKFATDLLRRCRALPLKGFQRITDLTTEQLIRSVNKAAHYESAWRHRGPRPIKSGPFVSANLHSNYMDIIDNPRVGWRADNWYKIVSAPPDEEVDWLSPITSSYTLCATKNGKVVCWDVQTDTCLAEWHPGERWELWKCRVEFEEKTVFFTMAKIMVPTYDDTRIMEFVLMRLKFSDSPSGESSPTPPVFSRVTEFRTAGVIMNVFLLDPTAKLLSAFIWIAVTNTIGLYVLLDWDKNEYVFVDTEIECIMSSNWSCILHEGNIVIHCEDSEGAFQYFYPLHLLQPYAKKLTSKSDVPTITWAVLPAKTISRKFVFPQLKGAAPEAVVGPIGNGTHVLQGFPAAVNGDAHPNVNPYPSPTWNPDSAHFVRQWWPTLPGVPRVSCTVVLLQSHDQETHRTRFVLAQHYFRVPLSKSEWMDAGTVPELQHRLVEVHLRRRTEGLADQETGTPTDPGSASGSTRGTEDSDDSAMKSGQDDDDDLMHLWYVSTPFDVVCVMDSAEDEEDGMMSDRPRPLVAVDFGHAVWIEFVENEDDPSRPERESEAKWLRFVTFPPFGEGENTTPNEDARMGGEVHTLEIPEGLDLDAVETINIDQSQGAIILSVRDGKIFILCYE